MSPIASNPSAEKVYDFRYSTADRLLFYRFAMKKDYLFFHQELFQVYPNLELFVQSDLHDDGTFSTPGSNICCNLKFPEFRDEQDRLKSLFAETMGKVSMTAKCLFEGYFRMKGLSLSLEALFQAQVKRLLLPFCCALSEAAFLRSDKPATSNAAPLAGFVKSSIFEPGLLKTVREFL